MKFIKKYYIIQIQKMKGNFMDKIQKIISFIKEIEISSVINLIIALAVIIIFLLLSHILAYWIVRLFVKEQDKKEIKQGDLYKSLKSFFNFSGIYIATKILNLNTDQNLFIDKCYRIVIFWTVARAISGIFEAREILIDKLNKESDIKKNAFMTSVVGKIVKIILYIIALYLSLKEFNYDIGGIATGLGLTGAVVALAAQDIVKQIFAGLTIFIDKPFEIGDWVEVGDISGTVEDITIKSTKIRTIEDTVVTVPNDTMTSSSIINWGKIKKRIYKANLKLALETEETTVEKVINRIRFILKYNKDIIKDSISVQFNKIDNDSINILIYVETTITKYIEYQYFCNKLNLTLLNILETQGVKLAYPGQNIYIKEGKISTSINSQETKEKLSTKPTKIKK